MPGWPTSKRAAETGPPEFEERRYRLGVGAGEAGEVSGGVSANGWVGATVGCFVVGGGDCVCDFIGSADIDVDAAGLLLASSILYTYFT